MSRNHPINRLMRTHPQGSDMPKDAYKLNLREAYANSATSQEAAHLRRRVLATSIYLRIIQGIAKRGVINGDTAVVDTTNMSMQVTTSSQSDNEAAHQVMGELNVDGQPVYGYWGDNGLTETERQAIVFLNSATSDIHFSFNRIDGLIERKGRNAFRGLGQRVVKPGGGQALSPDAIFTAVVQIFRAACREAFAELTQPSDVFERERKSFGAEPTPAQFTEDTATARDLLENYIKRLGKIETTCRAYACKPLDELMNEIRHKAFGMAPEGE